MGSTARRAAVSPSIATFAANRATSLRIDAGKCDLSLRFLLLVGGVVPFLPDRKPFRPPAGHSAASIRPYGGHDPVALARQRVLCAVTIAAERARLANERRIDDVVNALSPQLKDDCAWEEAVRAGATLLAGPVTLGIARPTYDIDEMTRTLIEEVRMGDALHARRQDAFRAACRNVLYRIRIPALIAKDLESCVDGSIVKLRELDPASAEVGACMTAEEWAALRDYSIAKQPGDVNAVRRR